MLPHSAHQKSLAHSRIPIALRHSPHMKHLSSLSAVACSTRTAQHPTRRSSLLSISPLLVPFGVALAACADPSPRDLGFTQSAQDLTNVPDTFFFSDANEFVGTWVGAAAEPLALDLNGQSPPYHFPSGSTRIAVEISVGKEAQLVGHISFGSEVPLPPPSDPDAGYPVGVAYDALFGYGSLETQQYFLSDEGLPPFEGFSYSVDIPVRTDGVTSRVPDGVATLAFSSNEALDSWCRLQTSYPHPFAPGSFSCAPDYGGSYESSSDGTGKMCALYGPADESTCLPDFSNIDTCFDPREPVAQVNCDKGVMCFHDLCYCDATHCQAAPTQERLSLRRVDDELVGAFQNTIFKNARGLSIPLGEVRLQRQ
jgi:hypothetical protein